MILNSKYNVNDNIWFQFDGRFWKGIIIEIKSWERDRGFLYGVSYCAKCGVRFEELIYENKIFPVDMDKEEIINKLFCDGTNEEDSYNGNEL